MDIEVLKEFITLSDKLNFSETAKIHFITQPVLSKHIQQLENTLGVVLFHRSRQSVELTMMGSAFLEDAQLIVSTYEAALKKMAIVSNKFESSFSLSFLDAAAKDFLPKIISQFITANPDISLELKNVNIPDTFHLLETRECDMSITLNFLPISHIEYDFVRLYRDSLCVFMNSWHPLAIKKSLKFKDLKDEKLIAASPDLVSDHQKFLESLLKKHNLSMTVKHETTSVEEGFMLVASGCGITIVPKHQQHFATSDIKMIPLDEKDCFVDVVLAWRKDNPNPNIPKMLKLMENLKIQDEI